VTAFSTYKYYFIEARKNYETMEACSNYSQSYDTTDTDHYYDEDHDDNLDGGNPHDRDVITSRGRSRSRSRRKTTASDNVGGSKKTSTTTSRSRIYNKITCPLSLVEQIRQSQGGVKSILPMCNDNDNNNDSDSIQTVKQRQNSIARVTNCMENNVDTVQLAKNYEVYKFANPCGLIHDSNDFYLGRRNKNNLQHHLQLVVALVKRMRVKIIINCPILIHQHHNSIQLIEEPKIN